MIYIVISIIIAVMAKNYFWPWPWRDSWEMAYYFWWEARRTGNSILREYWLEMRATHSLREHTLTEEELEKLVEKSKKLHWEQDWLDEDIYEKIKLLVAREKEEDCYCVWLPYLPGCCSQGDTIVEANANIIDAFVGCKESYEQHGEKIPWTIFNGLTLQELAQPMDENKTLNKEGRIYYWLDYWMEIE